MIPLSGDIPNSKGAICENIDSNSIARGTSTLKRGFAHMLKNGVVMDVTTVEQAQIAEEAGAVSVMVLDKLPSDSFSVRDDINEFVKFGVKITYNGEVSQLYWPEQDATEEFIPPMMVMVQEELESIMDKIRE